MLIRGLFAVAASAMFTAADAASFHGARPSNPIASVAPPPAVVTPPPPNALPQHPAGLLVVSTRGNGRTLLIDPVSGAVGSTIEAGIGLHEIASAPDGSLAVGSAYGAGPRHQTPDKRLCVLDLASGTLLRTVELVDAKGLEHFRPNDLVFLPGSRRVLVTSEVRTSLLEVDVVEGRIVREIQHGLPAGHMLAVTPDGRRAFVPSVHAGTVAAIDLEKGEVIATIAAGVGAEGVACSPDGAQAWVANNRAGSITVIDVATLSPLATFPAAGFPFRVRFTPDGRRVLVTCPQANVVRVYDAMTREIRGEIATDPAPTSIAVEPGGSRACVVSAASGRVQVLDLETMTVALSVDAGPEADGLAWARAMSPSAAPAVGPAAPTVR